MALLRFEFLKAVRTLLPPPWRWRQQGPSKRWYPT